MLGRTRNCELRCKRGGERTEFEGVIGTCFSRACSGRLAHEKARELGWKQEQDASRIVRVALQVCFFEQITSSCLRLAM